jgi:hypothetical protein
MMATTTLLSRLTTAITVRRVKSGEASSLGQASTSAPATPPPTNGRANEWQLTYPTRDASPNDGFGATTPAPASQGERPLPVRSRDVRRDPGLRARRADSRHSKRTSDSTTCGNQRTQIVLDTRYAPAYPQGINKIMDREECRDD